jgi:hypothetical protein
MPSLMDLPAEVRNMIYEPVLVQDEEISFGNISGLLRPPKITTAFTNHLAMLLPLTQVSVQIRDETTPMLFGRNTFNVVLTTHKHEGPRTQLNRQHRSAETKVFFDETSASTAPGHLTYGDRRAAAWIKIARPEAIKHIQRLTVEVEKADLVTRWPHLRHLYETPNISQEALRVFAPSRWYSHAIELRCPGLDTNVWSIDCKENRIHCKEVVRVGAGFGFLGSQQSAKPCDRCRMMLLEWGLDRQFDGELRRGHFLGLVWYHGQ